MALNFFTGEGVDYCPNNCNDKDIEALISNYFESNGNDESNGGDCKSTDQGTRNNEDAK